jgi:hypothetical protein
MKFETHWHEARPLLLGLLLILLGFLLIALVVAIGTALFARMTGRPWYDALPIWLYLAYRGARGWFPQKTQQTDETEPKPPTAFPTFAKIGRGLRRIFPVIRNMFLGILVVAIMAGSIWVLITLLRWFWLHPLFR